MNLEDRIKDLNPELQEKARACASAGELLAVAKNEGYKLSDDELEAIAGGSWYDVCPEYCPLDMRI